MEINNKQNNLYYIYFVGFFLILTLPLLVSPFLFFPPDWGKTIIFRSIMSILLFLFTYQLLFGGLQINLPNIKNNKIIWLFAALFIIYLLATIFSVDLYFSFWGSPYRSGGFLNIVFYFVFAILTFLLIKKTQWQKVWDFVLTIGILVSIVAVVQQYGLLKIFVTRETRMPSTLGNTIFLAIYLLFLFFIALSFLLKEKSVVKKVFYTFAVLLFLWVIIFTGSRAAYLGIGIGMLYFIILYPSKKLLFVKLLTILVFIAAVWGVYFINTNPEFIQAYSKNKIIQQIAPRLSIKLFLADPRFSAWQIAFDSLKEKPILGWGPENFDIAFDKHYDPSLPYIDKYWGSWYDRAHNFVFDIAVTAGIPALLAYLALLGVLFWQLQRLKYVESLIVHGVQATFIGYLTANFFSFDSFPSYLIFFLLIAYSLHLIWLNYAEKLTALNNFKISTKIIKQKKIIIVFLIILLVWFIWFYNIKALAIGQQINLAQQLADKKNCKASLELMDKVLKENHILNYYSRIKYEGFLQKCSLFYPEKNLEYAKRSVEILKEASNIRPLYTQIWIHLGASINTLIENEKNEERKAELIKEADYSFQKAEELSPKRQEIFIEWAKTAMVTGDFQKMKERSLICLNLNPNIFDCYWSLGLSEIFLGNLKEGKNLLKIAEEKQFSSFTLVAFNQLIIAYSYNKNYEELVDVYKKLIDKNPAEPQYHATLSFTYKELGQYEEARKEALIFLKMMPEAKEEVQLFLKTLPR